MLQPIMTKLATQRIVLASGSPRRRLILENIGLKCEVIPSTFEENLDKSQFDLPADYVKETAREKSLEVARRLCADEKLPDLVIGADTVVTMDNKIFEKPKDKDDAFRMLSGFSGRKHTVFTGISLVTPKSAARDESLSIEERFNIVQFHEATDVQFAEISAETIKSYIETDEPMDKAGGYGIQAVGGTLIEGIQGDYFNVMGFPLHRFAKHVLKMYEHY